MGCRTARARQWRQECVLPFAESADLYIRQCIVAPNSRRYRLHRKDLPGKPDLVFGPRRKVIFVHGCFWHMHPKSTCRDARAPKSNTGYWSTKLARNVERDAVHTAKLKAMGWRVLIIWECETRDAEAISRRIRRFLG